MMPRPHGWLADTWIHSIVVVAAGAVGLVAMGRLLAAADVAGLPGALDAPAAMFALLAPGLVVGWFTRRHPLLVGAAAAVLAELAAIAWFPHRTTTSPIGQVVASGMTVAVAALAGRALRYRFKGNA